MKRAGEFGQILKCRLQSASRNTVKSIGSQGRNPRRKIGPKIQNGWGCWKTGLLFAQRTYQGKAVAQNTRMTMGCRKRNGARHWRERAAQSRVAPPARTTAAGPFASTAAPRKNPNAIREIGPGWGFCNISTATAIADVSRVANSMSGLAARAKPIIATDVGSIRSVNQAAPRP